MKLLLGFITGRKEGSLIKLPRSNNFEIYNVHKSYKMVLDSWLDSFHSDNNWKWIYCLSCEQQTTAPYQNQFNLSFYRAQWWISALGRPLFLSCYSLTLQVAVSGLQLG